MTNEKRSEALSQALQKRIKTFTRLEKAFYGAIIITAITLAVSIILWKASPCSEPAE